jgi:hypothetical protein
MSHELRLSLRNQPVGKEETPWLEGQRARFAKAAHEVAIEMKDSKLRHTARVLKMNALVSAKLRNPDFQV